MSQPQQATLSECQLPSLDFMRMWIIEMEKLPRDWRMRLTLRVASAKDILSLDSGSPEMRTAMVLRTWTREAGVTSGFLPEWTLEAAQNSNQKGATSGVTDQEGALQPGGDIWGKHHTAAVSLFIIEFFLCFRMIAPQKANTAVQQKREETRRRQMQGNTTSINKEYLIRSEASQN
ncbi:hypothetical protein BDP55DRAFT_635982 [Colletotrichum godetiae]|uniref:Uncharacterized protein n=1 Tax=Colletotrichum godetiae TaxID=1209918 RepID=A0AAJ0ACL2_9PEZI|nr:uncharacterized protein BDP55DRAFT_635982 [Colletotrichum godetiae]KAK1671337.1 hypothetical protein BDP55DRAFT_635982 [Colletotrichum godetiae]